MKEWNTPDIEELKITETANGLFNSDVETFMLFNDSKKPSTPRPVYDGDDGDAVNQLS